MTTNAFDWHGDDVVGSIEEQLADRLDTAAEQLRATIVDRLGHPDSGDDHRSGSPGEYPNSESGRLRDHLFHDAVDPLTHRVFTDLDYGLMLELGTRHMRPRPFLTRALREAAARLADILTAGANAR